MVSSDESLAQLETKANNIHQALEDANGHYTLRRRLVNTFFVVVIALILTGFALVMVNERTILSHVQKVTTSTNNITAANTKTLNSQIAGYQAVIGSLQANNEEQNIEIIDLENQLQASDKILAAHGLSHP